MKRLAALIAAVLVLTSGCYPKDVDPRFNSPTPTVERPMKSGVQPAPEVSR